MKNCLHVRDWRLVICQKCHVSLYHQRNREKQWSLLVSDAQKERNLYNGHDTGKIPVSNGLSSKISQDVTKGSTDNEI